MKIIFISDTHGKHKELQMPELNENETNIIAHSGDFSHNKKQFFEFMEWYSDLEGYNHRLIVPGNHDLCVQNDEEMFYRTCKEYDIIGLIDKEIIIDGVKFYGSPWTPEFYNWAYMEEDYLLDKYWDKIPEDTNVLITHGPAYGILDEVMKNNYIDHVGSESLADSIDELIKLKNLKIHEFGHIHVGRGMYKENNILRINASCVDKQYNIKEPIVIDYNTL
jgi:Icc-related predicted phosphoesterase